MALVNSILEFSVELELKYQGLTKGLLGNFNGNNADDFIFPNGTTLPNNTSERELYEYGKTCRLLFILGVFFGVHIFYIFTV